MHFQLEAYISTQYFQFLTNGIQDNKSKFTNGMIVHHLWQLLYMQQMLPSQTIISYLVQLAFVFFNNRPKQKQSLQLLHARLNTLQTVFIFNCFIFIFPLLRRLQIMVPYCYDFVFCNRLHYIKRCKAQPELQISKVFKLSLYFWHKPKGTVIFRHLRSFKMRFRNCRVLKFK